MSKGTTAPVITGLVVGIMLIMILSFVLGHRDVFEQERRLYIMYASLHADPLQDQSEIPPSIADRTFSINDHNANVILERLPSFIEVLENAQSEHSTVPLQSISQVSTLFEILQDGETMVTRESRELHKGYFPGTNVLVEEYDIAIGYKDAYYLLTLEIGWYRAGL